MQFCWKTISFWKDLFPFKLEDWQMECLLQLLHHKCFFGCDPMKLNITTCSFGHWKRGGGVCSIHSVPLLLTSSPFLTWNAFCCRTLVPSAAKEKLGIWGIPTRTCADMLESLLHNPITTFNPFLFALDLSLLLTEWKQGTFLETIQSPKWKVVSLPFKALSEGCC